MNIQRIRIDQVNIGKRLREDLGDLDELAERMKARKMAAPIAVKLIKGTTTYKLLAGYRRLRAVRDKLNESMIWAMVLEPQCELEELLIERDENYRKDYNPIEMAKLGQKIEDLIGNRRGQHHAPDQLVDRGPQVADIPSGEKTRDFAADAVGFESSSAYRKAKEVATNGTPALQKAVVDGTVSLTDAATVAKEEPKAQNEAVKKVRAKKAKTVKEAVGKSDADETLDQLKDALGHAVPDSCAESFRNLDNFAILDSLCRQLQSGIDDLSQLPGGLQLRRHLQPTGAEGKTINKSEHLNSLKRDLKGTRPYAVCPWCVGAAKKDCKGCSGDGWITKITWDNADDKTKARMKKGD